jgi:hypothetical protein
MMSFSAPRPSLPAMATEISLIKVPCVGGHDGGSQDGTGAFLDGYFTKPSVCPSATARSLSAMSTL